MPSKFTQTRSRSQALRSGSVVLSDSSTLQGLSDSRHRRHRIAYPIGVHFRAIRLGEAEDDAGLRFYLSLLSQHAITLTPGPS